MNERFSRNLFLKTLFVALAMLGILGCRPGSRGPAAEVGKPAPDFTLRDGSGNEWNLSSLKGNLVFLNFWATWCAPCREEMPDMEALRRSLEGQPFRMVSILYQDAPPAAAQYVNEGGFNFPVLLDPDGAVARQYGVTGVPETYLIDADGILKERYIGARAWNQNPQKASLRRLLPSVPRG